MPHPVCNQLTWPYSNDWLKSNYDLVSPISCIFFLNNNQTEKQSIELLSLFSNQYFQNKVPSHSPPPSVCGFRIDIQKCTDIINQNFIKFTAMFPLHPSICFQLVLFCLLSECICHAKSTIHQAHRESKMPFSAMFAPISLTDLLTGMKCFFSGVSKPHFSGLNWPRVTLKKNSFLNSFQHLQLQRQIVLHWFIYEFQQNTYHQLFLKNERGKWEREWRERTDPVKEITCLYPLFQERQSYTQSD